MSQLIRKARESTEGSRLTVHDYWNPSASRTRTQDAVVNEARHLILSAARRSSWRTAKPSGNATRIKPDFCFVLSKEPPTISFSAQDTTFLKTWGDPATDDEIYRISELESFIGTKLEYLLEGSTKDDASPRNQDRIKTEPSFPTFKRQRLNIGSLYGILPQPHIHPSPFLSFEASHHLMPFNRREPVFVSPHTDVSLSDDARVAWLVPVRGILPWDDCSSAVVLDDSEDLFSPAERDIRVTWSRESLLQFWNFLIDLRKSGTLGALGISFHISRSSLSVRHTPPNHRAAAFPTPVQPSHPTAAPDGSRSTIKAVDYIKIYHDNRRKLHLRRILDEWTYTTPAGCDRSERAVLAHSRLALLNDISQVILIL